MRAAPGPGRAGLRRAYLQALRGRRERLGRLPRQCPQGRLPLRAPLDPCLPRTPLLADAAGAATGRAARSRATARRARAPSGPRACETCARRSRSASRSCCLAQRAPTPATGPSRCSSPAAPSRSRRSLSGRGDTVLWLWSGPDMEPQRHGRRRPGRELRLRSRRHARATGSSTPTRTGSRSSGASPTTAGSIRETMRGEVEVVALPSTNDRTRPSISRARVRAGAPSLHGLRALDRAGPHRAPQLTRWRAEPRLRCQGARGRNRVRLPLRGLEPGGYRLRMTAYDAADNRSRTLMRRFRLA